jgi:hypothetical protein
MKKGDRVICKVSMILCAIEVGCSPITKGHIDTIREIVEPIDNSGTSIYLEGIKNPIHSIYCQEYGYCIKNFEKLVSDEELLEYKKNVSMKENLSPELIPKKLVTC